MAGPPANRVVEVARKIAKDAYGRIKRIGSRLEIEPTQTKIIAELFERFTHGASPAAHCYRPIEITLSFSRIALAWLPRKTTCGVFIFIRSAGMSQRDTLRSNFGHLARINSEVRTNVSAMSCRAKRVCSPPAYPSIARSSSGSSRAVIRG